MIIHILVSYLCVKIPLSFFDKDHCWFRIRRLEFGGKIYQKIFKIRSWKKLIPDGASIFKGGFPKKKLESSKPKYLKTFLDETKRAELTHLLTVVPVIVFFLWNVWWVGIIMIIYALIVNIPCILLQRYNRARIEYCFTGNYIKINQS